jgi:peptide/nickel transport system substrate-binding protein
LAHGQPLTAEDVKFTFDYMKQIPNGRYSHHVWESPVFSAAEVLDPLTVRLTFEEPAPTFMILPGADLPIVPKHIWENIAPKDAVKATDTLPIGSGPYRVTEIVPDQRYKFEANAAYFKGRPKVDVIDLPIVEGPLGRLRRTPDGPHRLSEPHGPAGAVRPAVEPGRHQRAEGHAHGVGPHPLQHPQGPAVRREAAQGDQPGHRQQRHRPDRAARAPVRSGRDRWIHPAPAWVDPSTGHQYDPALADRNLDAAGYQRDSDGIRRTPDGKRLELNVLVSANDPQQHKAAQRHGHTGRDHRRQAEPGSDRPGRPASAP